MNNDNKFKFLKQFKIQFYTHKHEQTQTNTNKYKTDSFLFRIFIS